ncbi:MAG: SIS domain-containing protein [Alphaproteobacteria bacterium]|jgi:D-sedoheptulose 7-phosphate isomerase|nr:phosphoheptose isomerase [Rhodospirillaceae bacterium]MDP6405160.1 SIS domain-containing protein [Alphaproteobacteria bacterium]MDP6621165.1 SIS domain-containing protein [Alphaproteobacteria bacterium]|tara:strand:- start:68 stop:667 length:600 start_codon:yes stop_codon:yes gene_type:complete
MEGRVTDYFAALAAIPENIAVNDAVAGASTLAGFIATVIDRCRDAHAAGGKTLFVGNGGSAAIASHMATDFNKNGGLRALAFNDASALTCYANDFSFDEVFARQISMHGGADDVLIAISSSGNSENIVRACQAGRELGVWVATLSGFAADNRLRTSGDLNLYVPSGEYGFVELSHQAVCHAIVDIACGWSGDSERKASA